MRLLAVLQLKKKQEIMQQDYFAESERKQNEYRKDDSGFGL